MIKVEGKGGITATVIADSIADSTEDSECRHPNKRITTFELVYPRFIHAEFMTHRMFSRNAASSRAIPVEKNLEYIKKHTAMPIHWGKNKPGMQADEELDDLVYLDDFSENAVPKEIAWKIAADQAIEMAEAFNNSGYHKQIVNRLVEPFTFIKVVCTATEYDNFFWLRRHKDAQPEIQELANVMWEARKNSIPEIMKPGEWHLPYVDKTVWDSILVEYPNVDHSERMEIARKVSASCCAQVSFRQSDTSIEKALRIYDRLVNSVPVHASPFEHQATPMSLNLHGRTGSVIRDKHGYSVSGNFIGWVQNRQLIDGNVCNSYVSD